MEKRKPTILDVETSQSASTITMQVDADILDFRGHFTDFPLLPGVSQIDWALFYAIEYLQTPPTFKGMEVIKFQEPILPDMHVNLALNWDEEKQKLAFKYSSQQGDRLVIHSSGKMKLGE